MCCFCNISSNIWCHNLSTPMHNSQRHFPDHPEPFKTIWNFPDNPEIFQTNWKLSTPFGIFFRQSGNFPDYPEIFHTIWQLSRQSANIPDNPETFQTGWKLSGSISRLRKTNFRMAMPRCNDCFWASASHAVSFLQVVNYHPLIGLGLKQ